MLADTVLEAATAALADARVPSTAIGITNQRASTVVWDRATSEPIGPAIGWQDLRTIGMCLEQQANGFRFAPNVSATKIAYLLDTYDPDRAPGPVLRHRRLVGHLDPDPGREPRDRRDQRRGHRACCAATAPAGPQRPSSHCASRRR